MGKESKLDRTRHSKKKMLQAMVESLGVVTDACKIAEICRATYYIWYKEDEDFRNEVDSIQDIALDLAESELHKHIKDGNITALIFYLKTKGKRRGYIERQEISAELNNIDHSPWDEKESPEKYLSGALGR